MAWNERTDLHTRSCLIYEDDTTGRRHGTATQAALRYESVLDSGKYDLPVDMTPQRVTRGDFDGWEVTSNGWHYRIGTRPGQPVGSQSGWVGFGGRKGAHWSWFRLEQAGWLNWRNRQLTLVGTRAAYTLAALTHQVDNITVGPEATPQPAAATLTWPAIMPGIDLQWRISGRNLKEEVVVSQTARDALRATFPGGSTSEIYFSMVFRMDDSDVPRMVKDGNIVRPVDDFEDDAGKPIELRTSSDELLALMPVADAYVHGGPEGDEVIATIRQRRRWYQVGGVTYMVAGITAAELNSLPAGPLIFDPTEQVEADADDGYGNAPSTFDNASDGIDLNNDRSYFRMQIADIAEGDTVDACWITFNARFGDSSGAPTFDFWLNDADNPAAPTDWTSLNGLTKTTDTYKWTPGAFTKNVDTSLPSAACTAILDEVVNENVGTWDANDYIIWIVEPDSGSVRRVKSHDVHPTEACKTEFEYTPASGGVNISATLTAVSSTDDSVFVQICHNLSATLTAESSTAGSVFVQICHSMAATLTAESSTADSVFVQICHNLVATLTAVSSTADDVDLDLSAILSATLTAVSSTADSVILEVLRAMAATLTAQSSTATDAFLQICHNLAGTTTAQSTTATDSYVQINHNLAGTTTAQSLTATDVPLIVLWILAATNLTAVSSTADDVDLDLLTTLPAGLASATFTSRKATPTWSSRKATTTWSG